jgi:hypothetical protein
MALLRSSENAACDRAKKRKRGYRAGVDSCTQCVEDDPLNQQILICARALAATASSGTFQVDGSCH